MNTLTFPPNQLILGRPWDANSAETSSNFTTCWEPTIPPLGSSQSCTLFCVPPILTVFSAPMRDIHPLSAVTASPNRSAYLMAVFIGELLTFMWHIARSVGQNIIPTA
ncbi:hypothetical protein MVEN_01188100 [Mycena venus]|uniref:Uncharacterized protein n=1 Tax=Mycena venus TaxID=2733690 RepID=A0A8H6Y3Y4_9AGAR|nr:hypothetical protein MVEN_01188100 [Mycena venus]